MANPSKSTILNDLAVTTIENRLAGVEDGFYKATPLLTRLMTKEKVLLDGGTDIRKGIIHDEMNGGYIGRGDAFNISEKETKTQMIWDWKLAYANVTINGWDEAMNQGAQRVIDLSNQAVDEAEMTLKKKVDYATWNQGNANSIDSLEMQIDDGTNYGTHGGVTRDTSTQGTAVKAQYDGTGGTTTLSILNNTFNDCTDGPIMPDLVMVATNVYPKLYDRVQPLERRVSEDLAKAGFKGLTWNGADVVQSSNIPSGYAYLLNTDFISLFVMKNAHMKFRGWFETPSKLEKIGQIYMWHALCVTNPRYCGRIVSLT